MRQDTIHEMNQALDVANEVIEEDEDWLTKTKYPATVTYTGNGDDLSDDYKVARDTLKGLISSGEFALTKLEGAIKENSEPKIFEAYAKLIGAISDLTQDLIKLQKEMKSIVAPVGIADSEIVDEDNDDELFMTTDKLNRMLDKKIN